MGGIDSSVYQVDSIIAGVETGGGRREMIINYFKM